MAFCPNCGAPVEGRFCARCGAQFTAGETTGTSAPPPQEVQSSGMSENVAGALAYLLGFITGILFLVLEPYSKNRNVRFHAFQSIFLSLAAFIGSWVIALLPFGLWLALTPIYSLAVLAIWLFMMWKTYNHQKVVLPVIGELAEKQA